MLDLAVQFPMVLNNLKLVMGDGVLTDAILHKHVGHAPYIRLLLQHLEPERIVVSLAYIRHLKLTHLFHIT